MRSIGLPELLLIPMLGLAYLALPVFVLWKFYQLLSKISDNVAVIRATLERGASGVPFPSAPQSPARPAT